MPQPEQLSGLCHSSALLVDLLCGSEDVASVLLNAVNGVHNGILHAKNCCGSMGIYVLSVLAAQQLDTCGTEQSAANKYGDVLVNLLPINLTCAYSR